MQRHPSKGTTFGGGPLANAVLILAAAIVIGVSLVLGVVAFLVLATLVLGAGAVIGVRNWWLRRKGGVSVDASAPKSSPGPSADVIEGEFHVVKDDKNS